jgi:hypothetical protein
MEYTITPEASLALLDSKMRVFLKGTKILFLKCWTKKCDNNVVLLACQRQFGEREKITLF